MIPPVCPTMSRERVVDAGSVTLEGRAWSGWAPIAQVEVSVDGGDTWTPADDGRTRHYVWALAVDPADPDTWYVSASPSPGHAHHRPGEADSVIYRRRGESRWESFAGRLPAPSRRWSRRSRRTLAAPGSSPASARARSREPHHGGWRKLPTRLGPSRRWLPG
jgi:hypothetical protein